jgi:hypothetical protein
MIVGFHPDSDAFARNPRQSATSSFLLLNRSDKAIPLGVIHDRASQPVKKGEKF